MRGGGPIAIARGHDASRGHAENGLGVFLCSYLWDHVAGAGAVAASEIRAGSPISR